jgi:hypothetical protein
MGMSTGPQSLREPDAADDVSFDDFDDFDDDVDDDVDEDGFADEPVASPDPEPDPEPLEVDSVDVEDFSSFAFPPPDLPRLSVL